MLAFALVLVLSQTPPIPGHPDVTSGSRPDISKPAPNADELLKRLDSQGDLKTREKSFEIAASIGHLYFGQGRWSDSLTYFAQALEKAAAAEKRWREVRSAPAGKSVEACASNPHASLQSWLDKAEERIKAKDAAGARMCLKPGIDSVLAVHELLGHAHFLSKNPKAAIEAYSAMIELDAASAADAFYARGSVLFDTAKDDVAQLKRAKSDLEHFLKQKPSSPRVKQAKALLKRTDDAIAAGGLTKLSPALGTAVAAAPPTPSNLPPALSPETMAAFQNMPRTEDSAKQIVSTLEEAEGLLAKSEFQSALDKYKSVMPIDPSNPRVRAGMAWTLVQLGKPTAERIWSVALQSPEAIDALGETLKSKGNAEQAKALWKRLASTNPQFEAKAAQ